MHELSEEQTLTFALWPRCTWSGNKWCGQRSTRQGDQMSQAGLFALSGRGVFVSLQLYSGKKHGMEENMALQVSGRQDEVI